MTSIRVNCPTPGCEDMALVLTPQLRPGMMTGVCGECGKHWRMKTGELFEVTDEHGGAPGERR
jgi:hypothetical protein